MYSGKIIWCFWNLKGKLDRLRIHIQTPQAINYSLQDSTFLSRILGQDELSAGSPARYRPETSSM